MNLKLSYYFPISAPLSRHSVRREVYYLNNLSKKLRSLVVISPDLETDEIRKISKQFVYLQSRVNKIGYLVFLFLKYFKKEYLESDAIYCRSVNSALPAIIAKRFLKNKKLIVGYGWQWSATESRTGNKVEGFIKQFVEVVSLRNADVITVPTTQMKAYSIKKFNLRAEKVFIVPTYIDIEIFYQKKSYKILDDELKIITIGRLHRDKNYPLLLSSIKKVVDSNLKVKLTIVGKGPLKDHIFNIVKDYNISINYIEFIENHKIPRLLVGSDLFLNTSKSEGHPKVLLEALSCGVPCVVTDVFGNNVVIEDGFNGLLASESPQDISSKIIRMYRDEDLRRNLGNNGRKFIESNCNIDYVIGQELRAINGD